MEALEESHSQDITGAKFHPFDSQKVITCGIDQMLNTFDFEGKQSMLEDDTMDTIYCSENSLLDCGFIPDSTLGYAVTSTSVEIVNLEQADAFTKIVKVSY